MATAATAPAPSRNDRFPPQIPYIMGNEACERFSFYGMRNILTMFLIGYLLSDLPQGDRAATAKSHFHLFVMGVYFFPLLGGFLADRVWGKYRTILWLSIVYCFGHLCLAVFEDNKSGFYTGLFLIALGSGGIKPCVSAMVGDQFTEANKHLVKKVFGLFYFIINFGSLFASLCIPKVLEWWGPAWAFGIPGALMAIATIIFWAGRHTYVDVPPKRDPMMTAWVSLFASVGLAGLLAIFLRPFGDTIAWGVPLAALVLAGGASVAFILRYRKHPPQASDPDSFLRVVISAVKFRGESGGVSLGGALKRHPPEAVEGARAVFRIMGVFSMIPVFWALFDQKASTWVVQAMNMDQKIGPYTFLPSQMQFVNPALVMMLIPLTTLVIYPAFERTRFPLTPLRRMTIGMAMAGVSFVIAGIFQVSLERGNTLSILWQLLPYAVLTLAEVLVSVTGLEFAYSQAPPAMKGTIMSLWSLAVSAGNFLVSIISAMKFFTGASQFFFYAGLIFVAAVIFGLIARRYKTTDYFRKAVPAQGEHVMPERKG